MATPREKEAAAYLEKHKIVELMDNLTSMLLFYRPENPTEFLINQLEQMEASKQKAVDAPCLFDESNLDSVFGILDPTKQKCITHVQYREALTTLGIADINIDKCPEGADEDRISRETFKREARKGLQRSSDTYFQF